MRGKEKRRKERSAKERKIIIKWEEKVEAEWKR